MFVRELSSNSWHRDAPDPLLFVWKEYNVHPGLSESFEVDSWIVKVSGQSRDILFKKHHL